MNRPHVPPMRRYFINPGSTWYTFVKLVSEIYTSQCRTKIQDLGSEITENFKTATREQPTQHGPPVGSTTLWCLGLSGLSSCTIAGPHVDSPCFLGGPARRLSYSGAQTGPLLLKLRGRLEQTLKVQMFSKMKLQGWTVLCIKKWEE